MRDNSGQGESKNNMRDPTMRDHEGGKGPALQSATMQERGSAFDITGNAKERGEDPSPGNRDRGETSSADREIAVDR
ncbi:MAG: hypothetical protein ACK4SZ_07885 [Allosphingosinicella sp.]|uniref:hypothetical protein n=1 Tax=Allosphingosinicella sp. TaxID=2823234 RepID=UPI0039465A01